MKQLLKKITPLFVKKIYWYLLSIPRKIKGFYNKWFIYKNYDSTAYWKSRASAKGQARVLWSNERYNQLYRIEQKKIIFDFIKKLPKGARVLDIGCGIGIVSQMMISLRNDLHIDAVDFEEMIQVARTENSHPNINYIISSAEEYHSGNEQYDLVLSSGCISAIRNIESLEKSLSNCAEMIKKSGTLLFIDPFHSLVYLARARYSSNDVKDFLKGKGLFEFHRSGVLFWPYRDSLAVAELTDDKFDKKFHKGEKLLKLFGKHTWSDYKVLAYRF